MAFENFSKRLTKPLMLGSSGPEVRMLQEALNDWDDDHVQTPVVVDGKFGKSTYLRVCFVQFWENMKEDGVVGRKTAEILGLGYGAGSDGLPFTISYDKPPLPPLTSPLTALIAVIVEGIKPLRQDFEDAIFTQPTGTPRLNLLRRDGVNWELDRLIETLNSLTGELPPGNVATATLRTAFQKFQAGIQSELDALQNATHGGGGYAFRYKELVQKLPVDTIGRTFDQLMRGDQSAPIALMSVQRAMQEFDRLRQAVPHVDDNGLRPGQTMSDIGR